LQLWRDVLVDGRDLPPTSAVVQELCAFSGFSEAEVRDLAANSAAITAQKWAEAKPATPEALRAFYQTVSNWCFGTLAYHARQAEGENTPLPVKVAEWMAGRPIGTTLDYGAGVATASLMFAKMGWKVAIADVSRPLLDFASWRFRQRGVDAEVIDLNDAGIGVGKYDLVTAYNTMAHVDQLAPCLTAIHAALKPGGLFIFDVDTRQKGTGNEWHLFERDYPIIRLMRRLGFRPVAKTAELYVYERVDVSAMAPVYGLIDQLHYNRPAMWALDRARRVKRKLLG